MKSAAEVILAASTEAHTRLLEMAAKVLGFPSDVYFPLIGNKSPYADSGNTFVYDTYPDVERRYLLFTGIVTEKYESDVTIDPFAPLIPRMFVPITEQEWARNSKVIVHFGNRELCLRIELLEGMQAISSLMYRKYKMIPMETIV